MDGTYPIGPNASAIFLEVAVSTPGEATTIAWKVTGGNMTEVAANDVNDPTGAIPKTNIGNASLAGSNIEVRTIVDLSLVDPGIWPAAYTNLSVTYNFSGGTAPQQIESDDADKSKNDSGSLIRVVKVIHITN